MSGQVSLRVKKSPWKSSMAGRVITAAKIPANQVSEPKFVSGQGEGEACTMWQRNEIKSYILNISC